MTGTGEKKFHHLVPGETGEIILKEKHAVIKFHQCGTSALVKLYLHCYYMGFLLNVSLKSHLLFVFCLQKKTAKHSARKTGVLPVFGPEPRSGFRSRFRNAP